MQWYSWKRPCRDHAGGVLINGPFNGRGAYFMIFGVDKPIIQTSATNNCDGTSATNNCDGTSATNEDETMSLFLGLLNRIF